MNNALCVKVDELTMNCLRPPLGSRFYDLFHQLLLMTKCSVICSSSLSYSVNTVETGLPFPTVPVRNQKLHHIIFLSPLSPTPPPLPLFNSSLLPSICCFHVSKIFLSPPPNFKYSLRVLSTIAYKHLEIIESQRVDKKGSSDRAQWKWSNMALSQPSL